MSNIDPNSRLAHGDIEMLIGDTDLTKKQIDAINEAIETWAEADPDGYSDYERHRLEFDILRILQ